MNAQQYKKFEDLTWEHKLLSDSMTEIKGKTVIIHFHAGDTKKDGLEHGERVVSLIKTLDPNFKYEMTASKTSPCDPTKKINWWSVRLAFELED
jgi:hypothetical protein